MPDLYRPFRLSCIQNIQAIGGQNYLYATVFYGFGLSGTSPVLSELVYTETAMANLPRGGFLDAGFPKSVPEFLIAGEAQAPSGQAVKAQEIGVTVGPVTKRAAVFGDRFWVIEKDEIRLSDAVPYETMPLTPERAFGNETHPVNPAGRGCDPQHVLDRFGYAALPNVENPQALVRAVTDRPDPVLFGPLEHDHPLRKPMAGQPSWDWVKTSFPEPPPGFDSAYHNVAPADQRLTSPLRGDEPVSVWGMSAENPAIQSRLPGLRIRLFAIRDTKAERITEIETRIETVWIFGSSEIGGLYHRGILKVADPKASDVVALIFGAERLSDAPRPAAYYAEIYRLRTHPSEGPMHTLNDSQLMPELSQAELEAMEERSKAYSEDVAQKFEKKIRFEQAEMIENAGLPEMMRPDMEMPPVPRLPLPAPQDIAAGNVDIAGMMKKLAAAADKFGQETMSGAAAYLEKYKAEGVPLPDDLLDLGKKMQDAMKSGDPNAAKALKEVAKQNSVSGGFAKAAKAGVDMSAERTAGLAPSAGEVMPGAVEEALSKIDEVLGKIDSAQGGAGEEELWHLVRARALALPEADPFYELKQNLEALAKDAKETAGRPKSGEMVMADEALGDPDLHKPKPTDFDAVLAELDTMPEENRANLDKLEAMLAKELPKTTGHDLPPSLALAREIEKVPVPEPDVRSLDDILAKAEEAAAMDEESFFGDLDEEAREFLLNREHPRSAMLEAVHPLEPYTPGIRKKLGALVVDRVGKGESFARRDIADADLVGADLSHLDLNGVFLEKANLSGADLRRSILTGAALTEAVLTDANAGGADFSRSSLSAVTAHRASMDAARFENRTWQNADFTAATFRKAVFDRMTFLDCRFEGADFDGARFSNCLFFECDLTGAAFRNAALEKTFIVQSDLSRSDWSGARFDRQLMTMVSAPGSRWNNAAFSRSAFAGKSDFKGAVFDGVKGHYASFLEAGLDETSFTRAEVRECLFLNCSMTRTDFRAAVARKAVFNDSTLINSDFFAADLMEAHLSLCDARYTSFRGANLYSANLMDANVKWADFSGANLGQTFLELPASDDT